jgi:hypothetical protein
LTLEGTSSADLDFDGNVNFADLVIFKAAFGSYMPIIDAHDADLNDDGPVNFADLAMFRIAFGTNSVLQGGTTGVVGGTGGGSSNVSLSEPSALGMFAAVGLAIAIGFRRRPKAE